METYLAYLDRKFSLFDLFLKDTPNSTLLDLESKLNTKYFNRLLRDHVLVDSGCEWPDFERDLKKYSLDKDPKVIEKVKLWRKSKGL